MMITKSNGKYANISSVSELRAARERLSWQIELTEKNIDRQYDEFRDMFTLSHLAAVAIRKYENVRSWMGTVYDGYRLVMSMFERGNDGQSEQSQQSEVVKQDTESELVPEQEPV